MYPAEAHGPIGEGRRWFATTQWSVVLAAGAKSTQTSQAALETLCRTYWYPLYAYVRRRGYSPEDAQDLTQSFFLRLLERQTIGQANKERGRFRSFLLSSLKHFLINEHAKSMATRRGGSRVHFSIDASEAENRYGAEPALNLTPDKLYEKRWATTVIDQALDTLYQEYVRAGNQELFDCLKDQLLGQDSVSYAELGRAFDMSEGAIKTAIYRLRKRYAEILRSAIAHTVTIPEEIEDEIKDLIGAFGT